MNQEANLYIRMWHATRDPKYIRLFREAMTQRVSKRTENRETMNENEPHVWDEASVKLNWDKFLEASTHMHEGLFTVADLPTVATNPRSTHVFAKYLPDRVSITEEQLIAEIEGTA